MDAKQVSVVANKCPKPGFVESCNAPWDDKILAGSYVCIWIDMLRTICIGPLRKLFHRNESATNVLYDASVTHDARAY